MAAAPDLETVHATAIALAGRGVLIRGPSGSGKSDLALRCLALPVSHLSPDQFQLIADDRVVLRRATGGIELTCPPAIAGQLEVRGIGIVNVPSASAARLALVADLVPQTRAIERMPEPAAVDILGHRVLGIKLHAFEASAPLKLLLAMTSLGIGP